MANKLKETVELIGGIGNNVNYTKQDARLGKILGIILFFIAILILYFGVESYKIQLSGENLTYIIAGLFFSGLLLIIIPMYFGNKIEMQEIQENKDNDKFIKKIEILQTVKDLIKEDDKFKNFSLEKSKSDIKVIFSNNKFELSIWFGSLDFGDFGRFYIYTKEYDSLSNEIKENFIKENGWKENSYPYKNKFTGLDNIKEQLDNIKNIII